MYIYVSMLAKNTFQVFAKNIVTMAAICQTSSSGRASLRSRGTCSLRTRRRFSLRAPGRFIDYPKHFVYEELKNESKTTMYTNNENINPPNIKCTKIPKLQILQKLQNVEYDNYI